MARVDIGEVMRAKQSRPRSHHYILILVIVLILVFAAAVIWFYLNNWTLCGENCGSLPDYGGDQPPALPGEGLGSPPGDGSGFDEPPPPPPGFP